MTSLRSQPSAAAAREALGSRLESGSDGRLHALYVHFPFCLSICPYCDFVVYAGSSARGPADRIGAFVDALVTEIGLRGVQVAHGLKSVYLGGGTPSLMSAAQVGEILGAAHRAFGIAPDAEITIEVNPGPDERGDLPGFRAAGVNRISMGAQSFDPAELKRLGRRHSSADIRATVLAGRDAGFDNVSLDLLYDVPGQTPDSWRSTLRATLELQPDHISAYGLDLSGAGESSDHLPVSRGARQWRARALRQQDEDRAATMYEAADEAFASEGLSWYEISNWARPGRESRHNLCYWTTEAWEAVGPGAHAFDGARTRRWNAAQLDGYVRALSAGTVPPTETFTSDAASADAERLILALRTARGIAASTRHPQIDWARGNGLLEVIGERLRLTRRGRLLSNELFARLLPEPLAGAA
jgi:oxygen-independent coproporphyrinogen III oxidase